MLNCNKFIVCVCKTFLSFNNDPMTEICGAEIIVTNII